jgi:glycosyltransferase involved in cell wall biosynthesis
MLGTIEPRKNHALALAAIRRANLGPKMPLVIVGRYGWGHEAVAADIQSMQADGLVIHIDNAADADLPVILANSTAMIYPSWTEGFGLPVAEALATGIPVVTGTAPALREVGGNFARYVDPQDVDALVSHIQELAETHPDPDIAAARTHWTRQFSWDSSTSTVYDALRRISR